MIGNLATHPVASLVEKYRERKAWLWLAAKKRDQLRRFRIAAANFANLYQSVRDRLVDEYVVDQWTSWNRSLEQILLPSPPESFLTIKRIRKTMFVQSGGELMRRQLCALGERWSEPELRRHLEEDAAGHPRLKCPQLMTSHNSIHHLYHLHRFSKTTSVSLDDIDRIVEWGGGYGNLAKLLLRLAGRNLTYTIIDTPLLSCVQYAYLRSVLPEPDRVYLHSKPAVNGPVEGSVNLMPLGVATQSPLSCDLFISTWALSESSQAAQEYVVEQAWFGARNLLLAFQDSDAKFPAAARVGSLAHSRAMKIENVESLTGNFYGFS